MKVICISGKARHGKDTAAAYIKDRLEIHSNRVLITHYGDLVKYVCKTFFGWNCKKDDEGRNLLQTVGTDIVRKEEPDFWVRFVADILGFFEQAWDYVIIPDCRFPNEVEYLVKSGFDVSHIRIVRDDYVSELTEEQQNHISETALDDYPPDIYVHNVGYFADFYENIRIAMEELGL